MKNTLVLLFLVIGHLAIGQSHTEKITKEYTFEKRSADNAIIVSNINGDVFVTGYEGDKILVEVVKTVRGKTEARLEKGKQVLQLGVIDRADSLIFYTDDGCTTFGKLSERRGRKQNGWDRNGWGYDWNCNNGNCKQEFDYTMDFTIKVPMNVHVAISTINNGDLKVEKVTGTVRADNVNGSIKLSDLTRASTASTINGDVDVDFVKAPTNECRFYSLNGDINALFPKGLGAELSFESFNGNFYTNINQIESLPVRVTTANDGRGLKYKVSGNRYQVGKGGVFLDFETFNGNVYLKEKI